MSASKIITVESLSPITTLIGQAVAKAMNPAPDYQFILKKKKDRLKPLSWFFGQFVTKLALKYGRIIATESGDAGIYTFSPGHNPSLLAAIGAGALLLPKHFGVLGTYRALVLGAHLEKRRLTLMPQNHWYVIALGVTPESQGHGKGYALLQEIIQKSDQDGVPIYIEVFEHQLISLYEKLGFTLLQVDHLKNSLTLWCLTRAPKQQLFL